ncbi:MAG: ATP synthase F0 subunit B [Dysosmobacter sp.]|mgnify:FL=1|nr:ATP synthase F0 subunit B [Dysosmobacter sp.]
MNIPLNIDWQQILLHWMNLAILTGGLYFLLYKPVKQFMEKREAHYRNLEEEAAGKLREAEKLKDAYQEKLDGAEEEIRQARAKAQAAVQQSVEEQMLQARQIVAKAKEEAASSREQIIKESQRELRELTVAAVKKLTVKADTDIFDQFLDLAEGGKSHEDH